MSVAICNDRNRRLLRQAFGGTSIEAEDEEFPVSDAATVQLPKRTAP